MQGADETGMDRIQCLSRRSRSIPPPPRGTTAALTNAYAALTTRRPRRHRASGSTWCSSTTGSTARPSWCPSRRMKRGRQRRTTVTVSTTIITGAKLGARPATATAINIEGAREPESPIRWAENKAPTISPARWPPSSQWTLVSAGRNGSLSLLFNIMYANGNLEMIQLERLASRNALWNILCGFPPRKWLKFFGDSTVDCFLRCAK